MTVSTKNPQLIKTCEEAFHHSEFQAYRKQILDTFPFLSTFDSQDLITKDLFSSPVFDHPHLIATWKSIAGCSLHQKKVVSVVDQQLLLLYFGIYLDDPSLNKGKAEVFKFIYGKDKVLQFIKNYPIQTVGAIIVPFHTTKVELLRWIDDHWDEINKLSKLPECVSDHLPNNLKVGVEINQLLSEKHTYAEIADRLSEKYPEDARLMDESQIKVIYHRLISYTKKQLLANQLLRYLWGNNE